MKKILIIPVLIMLLTSCNENKEETGNPLLDKWNTPFETPPFDKIKNEHYLPAIEEAIKVAKEEVIAIADNAEEATFANTIEALGNSGKLLNRVAGVFFNINQAETNDTLDEIANTISPLVSDFSNDINLNENLFKRIKAVKEQEASLALTPEQKKLLEDTYRGFVRSGANLNDADKAKFRELSNKLSIANLNFGQNALAATNAYTMHITNESDLAGLPEGIKDAAAHDAKEKELEGWLFTLQAPSYGPFITYADNRALREKMYMANGTKGIKGENSNVELIKTITNLRLDIAKLLGYNSYAEYSLEESMAKNTENVNNLLNELLEKSKPFAIRDVEEVQKFATDSGANFKIMPWDYSYYTEKLKAAKYSLDEEMTRPYFKLENVITGVFGLANKLFGITLEEQKDIPVYHPDVKTYKVTDENNKFLAILYVDFFPRAGKSGGAWMTNFREQSKDGDKDNRPFVSLVCNFTKPTATKPALLTHREVETFMHEFGHGLHGMLSDVKYEGQAGTNVYRDFVELPSQMLENWAVEKEFLDMFAEHYETGEKIPADLIEKIKTSSNFMEGYASIRQLNFGRLDMAYHTLTEPLTEDITSFERKAMAETQVLPIVEGTLVSPSFSHIFEGGYAAGYYSYKWSEVLDADAYSLFQKNGIFDKATATSYRDNILKKGGTEDPMQLYVRFRGQEPTTEALLIRSGFVNK